MDVRELSLDEIDMVSGGNWFANLFDAIAQIVGYVANQIMDAAAWLAENGFYYEEKDGGYEFGFR
ncbi:MAG: hypothetical protein B7Y86_01780 [Brevundimonas subvibrioides]|uniref:Bacteriocin n=1 Tax=Brevundimonas subvibrioides TaxID=74313 RepID=A0A258HS43_9CAUL|nr:MAG: hypothetical protein B7Y86_01780 [Brevundimonas subvibrioides]